VVVVGAGYTGLSAALHLAERGAEVAVLDAAEPGWGASGRNGGQIIPGLKHDPDELERQFGDETGRRMWEIAGGAADAVFDLVARYKIACHAERCGWIAAAPHAAALESLRSRTEQWQRRGAPVELLDASRIAELTGTTGYMGGMLDRRAGALQPLAFVRGLARAAREAGAAIHGRSAVERLESTGEGWRARTAAGHVTARTVILATNAYTDDLWPGLRRTVLPVQSYQVATRPLPDNVRRRVLPGGHGFSVFLLVSRHAEHDKLKIPVLLKPESESGCQVVIRGRPRFHMKAREHERYRAEAWPEIVGSYEALAENFDLIVIDECHRGSAAEDASWREILDYFDKAIQVGLTATPKETKYVSSSTYFGEPAYTYSLKRGIEDGFLAPYKVVRIDIDKDVQGWTPPAGMKDDLGQEIEQREYNQLDMDRILVLNQRTKLVANRVMQYLRATNPFDKTIVFCEDIDHAERMRKAIVNAAGEFALKNPRYVMRITGDSTEGKAELDNFIDPESPFPVIATTSELLTTGVDAKTCKLIVLDKNITSMTTFKQCLKAILPITD